MGPPCMGPPLGFLNWGYVVVQIPMHPFIIHHIPTTVEARKLEYDCPPTPKPIEEGIPAWIVPSQNSTFLKSTLRGPCMEPHRKGNQARGHLQGLHVLVFGGSRLQLRLQVNPRI